MTSYTIGRGKKCDITIPNASPKIGTHHATLHITKEGYFVIKKVKKVGNDFKKYTLYINGFRVNSKRVTPSDSISLEGCEPFQLHQYFKFREHSIVGVRKDKDFTEEMLVKAKNWQSVKEIKRKIDTITLLLSALIIGGLGILSFSFSDNTTISAISSLGLGSLVFYFIRSKANHKKEDKVQEIKKENLCPNCKKFIDLSWQEVKQTGSHDCGAFWKL